jgi:hypothetical protein
MNATRGGSSDNNNNNNESLQNERLAEIREQYETHRKTPQQRRDDSKKAVQDLLQTMRRNGATESALAMFAEDMRVVDSYAEEAPEEDPRDKIVSETFPYNNGGTISQITISSKGSRHWRVATVEDVGSIVYLPMDNEFGELDDTGYETDEEFPDVKYRTAIIYTFSGRQETQWESDGKFEDSLIVPDEVLQGVKTEAPPGKFFSGKSCTNSLSWKPAPDGKTWLQHPFLRNPSGMYLTDEQAYYTKKMISCPEMHPEIMEKGWRERGSLAFWCPVLKRFLSEGEMFRQQHWFHNGDGSAQERYYYNQCEMLDMHGGLANLPVSISSNYEDVCFVGVMGCDEVIAKRRKEAEAKGEVIAVDQEDSKMPAKKQRMS